MCYAFMCSGNLRSHWEQQIHVVIGPLQDLVTWYGINYTGTQMTQWDFQNKGTLTSPARLSFVLEVPLRHLHPSVIYFVPCDRIPQRAYYNMYLLLPIRPEIPRAHKCITHQSQQKISRPYFVVRFF